MAPSREKEIRGHTERFRTIAELGNDGIFVLDESDRIEFANTMASIITDIPMEKLFGKDFKGLLKPDRSLCRRSLRTSRPVSES
jgi:Transcriptional regulator containing PAS, AAA-type ATPase, and DNA-binding domains